MGEAVYLHRQGTTAEVRRDEIRRLCLRKPGHGGRRAVVGAVTLFALVGAGVGYALGHSKSQLVYTAPSRAH